MYKLNRFGVKVLRDENDYYFCLLELQEDSKVIGVDYKYRTNKAYIHEIVKISSLRLKHVVNHICFHDDSLFTYEIGKYVYSDLDESNAICAKGIHFFPFFGLSFDHLVNYFCSIISMNIVNVKKIYDMWHTKILHLNGFIHKEEQVILLSKKMA